MIINKEIYQKINKHYGKYILCTEDHYRRYTKMGTPPIKLFIKGNFYKLMGGDFDRGEDEWGYPISLFKLYPEELLKYSEEITISFSVKEFFEKFELVTEAEVRQRKIKSILK